MKLCNTVEVGHNSEMKKILTITVYPKW